MYNTQNCRRISKQSTIDNIITQLNDYPKTEINKTITARLSELKDKDDNYYIDNNVSYNCRCLNIFYQYRPNNIRGKPISETMSDLLAFIINYIIENSDECQFSLKEILKMYTDEHREFALPRLDRIEHGLKQHFEDEIVTYSTVNDRFICFKQTLGQCSGRYRWINSSYCD